MARLVKTAAVPSLIHGSDVSGMPPAQLNEARLIARKICREKTYHRCLDLDVMLEDAGTDLGRRGATSAILVWQCAWVERWVLALWMTKTLPAASQRRRDCINPCKLVNGLASAVVAGAAAFPLRASSQDAYDRWTWERACNRIPALTRLSLLHQSSPCSTCARRENTRHGARGSLFSTMRTQNLEWLGRFSLDRSCQLCLALVGSLCHRCYKCPTSAEFTRGYCHYFDPGNVPSRPFTIMTFWC